MADSIWSDYMNKHVCILLLHIFSMTCLAACRAVYCIRKHNTARNHSCFTARVLSGCTALCSSISSSPGFPGFFFFLPLSHSLSLSSSHQPSLGIRHLPSIVDLTLGSTLLRWRIVAERCFCQERAYPLALATLLYIKYQTSEGQYADLL